MAEHSLMLINREHLEISGVTNVNTFDEKEIIIESRQGYLYIAGQNMHVSNLNLDEGKVSIDGSITSIEYKTQSADLKSRSKNIIQRLLK
ncbi:MAG: sporulation protein YabP [Syntrophomonadaceae bacterium]|jgi:sporulation protein YabP|nr:sporulation protein YabP [Syntrophomonadaceae bacterium]